MKYVKYVAWNLKRRCTWDIRFLILIELIWWNVLLRYLINTLISLSKYVGVLSNLSFTTNFLLTINCFFSRISFNNALRFAEANSNLQVNQIIFKLVEIAYLILRVTYLHEWWIDDVKILTIFLKLPSMMYVCMYIQI